MMNSARFRWLLAAAIVVAILSLAGYIIIRLEREGPLSPPHVFAPPGVDVSLEGLRFSEGGDGGRKWDLVAEKAEYDKGRGVTRLTAPVMTLPPSQGSGALRLRADRALYRNETRDVSLEGNVLLSGERGMRFTTDRADFVAADAMVRTAARVKLQQPGLVVEGAGMELDTVTRNLRVLSDVTAVITPVASRNAGPGNRQGPRTPRE
jgi:LPS export ABC transporter protein LptC